MIQNRIKTNNFSIPTGYSLVIIVLTLFMQIQSVFAQDTINLVGKLTYSNIPVHDVWRYVDDSTGTPYALLCASTSGMRMIDISDPENPMQAGTISGGGVQPIDVKTWKNFAYTVAENTNITGKIIDLSDPSNLAVVGTFPGGHNMFISDSGYLYLAAPGLRIYNLNIDATAPIEVYNDNSCRGHDISIVGNRLYDFSDNCGTRIYDITNPVNPVLMGTVTASAIFHHSGWPSADGSHLFICDEGATGTENDITVWDISNLSNPVMVDSFMDSNSSVHNLYVIDNYAYVSYYRAGFRIFDISDPANIFITAEYDTDTTLTGDGFGGNFGVYPFSTDGNILASDEENGLYIFSFSPLNTGIRNHEEQITLTVFPNPAHNSLNVSLEKFTEARTLKLINMAGQEVINQKIPIGIRLLTLNISDQLPGLYAIKLSDRMTTVVGKVMIF